jgi:hypothetical protein
MDEHGAHVVILVVFHDLGKRKHMTLKKAVAAADLRTLL